MTNYKRKIRKTISVIISIIILYSIALFTVNAADCLSYDLSVYQKVISQFNERYNTNYQIATEQQLERVGLSLYDEIEFITTMSEEQFWDYLCQIHKLETSSNQNIKIESYENNNVLRVSPLSKTQRYYYYSGSSNYLYMTSTYLNVDSKNRYSSVDSFGTVHSSYPYWYPTQYSYQITNYSTQVIITFKYQKYLSRYIIDSANYQGSVTFNVNGGNVGNL